jgi:HlyD family secretion protein
MRTALIVTVLLGGGFFIYTQLSGLAEARISYRTAVAGVGQLREVVTASGTVNAVVTVDVGSQLSGNVAELDADFNDVVSKGQALAVLDQRSYQARVLTATAALDMARATVETKIAELDREEQDLLEVIADKEVLDAQLARAEALFVSANAELGRKEKLGAGGSVAQGDLDEAKAAQQAAAASVSEAKANLSAHSIKVAAARAEVARAKAELKNAKASVPEKEAAMDLAEIELNRTVIRSPIDGMVIGRKVDAGQTVAASLEAPTLFTIAKDLSEMEVHARIDETDIGKIRLDQTATFTVEAFPGRRFSGKVVQVRKAPEMLQDVVTYTVVILTRNEDLVLLPGMTALVRVIVMESEPTLLVPTAALLFRPSALHDDPPPEANHGHNDAVVWRLDQSGHPRPLAVKTGAADNENTSILGVALEAGQDVIIGEVIQPPSHKLFGIRLGF